MQVLHSLPSSESKAPPVVLTIGNFDGVHLGHQAVLHRTTQLAKKHQHPSAVITFANHPSTVLRPQHPTPLLCSIEHKLQLLEKAGIDLLILLQFTEAFSKQSAEVFLHNVKHSVPFDHLILGSDAHIGKNREGDREVILLLSKSMGFKVEYLADYQLEGARVSSTLLREAIQKGDLSQVGKLLGRTYSIFSKVIKGHGRGASIGFPTTNLSVEGLCLPPLGVYAVSLWHRGVKHPGVANLGVAPTVRENASPLLEVHLFDKTIDLYDEFVDVHFHQFIRPEKRFASLEELKMQIAKDAAIAKKIA